MIINKFVSKDIKINTDNIEEKINNYFKKNSMFELFEIEFLDIEVISIERELETEVIIMFSGWYKEMVIDNLIHDHYILEFIKKILDEFISTLLKFESEV